MCSRDVSNLLRAHIWSMYTSDEASQRDPETDSPGDQFRMSRRMILPQRVLVLVVSSIIIAEHSVDLFEWVASRSAGISAVFGVQHCVQLTCLNRSALEGDFS